MSINAVDLFPYANELFLCGYKNRSSLPQLVNCRSALSSLVLWSLLTKISTDDGNVVHATKLETILRLAYNVHKLEINDDSGILPRAILRNYDNLGTRVSQQVRISILKQTLSKLVYPEILLRLIVIDFC